MTKQSILRYLTNKLFCDFGESWGESTLNKKKLSSAKIVILMMLIMIATKFFGFIREILLGQQFGTSFYTDAYIVALTVPTIIFGSIMAAVSTSFIPIYSKIKHQNGMKRANYFTNNLLSIITMLSIILAVIGFFVSKFIVKILGAGLSAEGYNLAVSLTRISLLMLVALGVIAVLTVFLQAEERFIISSLINIPIILTVIISLFFVELIGIKGVMYANVIGSIFQILILIYYARRQIEFKLVFNLKDNNIKELFALVFPVLIATSVQQINLLIDRMLASSFGDGYISALSFGSKINEMFFGLISVTIATFIFPKLSNLATKNSMKEFNDLVRTSLNTVSILILPLVFIVLLFSIDIVKLLFERGEFDHNSTITTANALFYYSFGMLFFGFRDVLNRTYYSIGDTKSPMKNAIVTVAFNILLSLILMNIIGYKGLALSNSLAGIVTCVILFTSLNKRIPSFNYLQFIFDQLKIIISSLIMIIVTWLIFNYVWNYSGENSAIIIIKLGSSIFGGIIIYVIMLLILKLEEVNEITNIIKEKIRKRE